MANEQPAIRDGSADAKFQGELATYIFVSVGHLRQKLNHLPEPRRLESDQTELAARPAWSARVAKLFV